MKRREQYFDYTLVSATLRATKKPSPLRNRTKLSPLKGPIANSPGDRFTYISPQHRSKLISHTSIVCGSTSTYTLCVALTPLKNCSASVSTVSSRRMSATPTHHQATKHARKIENWSEASKQASKPKVRGGKRRVMFARNRDRRFKAITRVDKLQIWVGTNHDRNLAYCLRMHDTSCIHNLTVPIFINWW